MGAVPQFGDPEPGRHHADRPAAFGVAERDGLIALVEIRKPDKTTWRDLPGGAIDPGETADIAVVREFGEEAGLTIAVVSAFAHADQRFENTDGERFNNRGTFFAVRLLGENPQLKIEDDHTLVWVDPHVAIAQLRHDAHAWAVVAWLRRVRA